MLMTLKFIACIAVVGSSWYAFHKTNNKIQHWFILLFALALMATLAN